LLELAQSDPAPSVRLRAGGVAEDPTADHEPPPFGAWPDDTAPNVVVETNRGRMEIQLFPDAAPFHVANFLGLVDDGFYDGLPWHRVVSNFVIQGGDPEGTGWGGPGWSVPDEISRRKYRRGTVGMPKAGKDTGGCQMFITHLPTPHLDGNYTVFGQVVRGLDVIDAIEVGDIIVRASRVEPGS
jgi:cyclophilin family peptidyl-prolyl cis-trans isomerase